MSETKFTKGEWQQSHREGVDGMYNTEVYDQDGETICIVAWHAVIGDNGVISTDREANAQLIATLPEMYDEIESDINELKEFTSTLKPYSDDWLFYKNKLKRKEDLLAKARGEK